MIERKEKVINQLVEWLVGLRAQPLEECEICRKISCELCGQQHLPCQVSSCAEKCTLLVDNDDGLSMLVVESASTQNGNNSNNSWELAIAHESPVEEEQQ